MEPPNDTPDHAAVRRRAKRIVVKTSIVVVVLFAAFVATVNMAAPPLPTRLPNVVADPYDAARRAYMTGDLSLASRLLRSVPKGDRHYSRAMRMLGYRILTYRLGQPTAGVPYVNEALLSDPTDGDAWVDLFRTYGESFVETVSSVFD